MQTLMSLQLATLHKGFATFWIIAAGNYKIIVLQLNLWTIKDVESILKVTCTVFHQYVYVNEPAMTFPSETRGDRLYTVSNSSNLIPHIVKLLLHQHWVAHVLICTRGWWFHNEHNIGALKVIELSYPGNCGDMVDWGIVCFITDVDWIIDGVVFITDCWE